MKLLVYTQVTEKKKHNSKEILDYVPTSEVDRRTILLLQEQMLCKKQKRVLRNEHEEKMKEDCHSLYKIHPRLPARSDKLTWYSLFPKKEILSEY